MTFFVYDFKLFICLYKMSLEIVGIFCAGSILYSLLGIKKQYEIEDELKIGGTYDGYKLYVEHEKNDTIHTNKKTTFNFDQKKHTFWKLCKDVYEQHYVPQSYLRVNKIFVPVGSRTYTSKEEKNITGGLLDSTLHKKYGLIKTNLLCEFDKKIYLNDTKSIIEFCKISEIDKLKYKLEPPLKVKYTSSSTAFFISNKKDCYVGPNKKLLLRYFARKKSYPGYMCFGAVGIAVGILTIISAND